MGTYSCVKRMNSSKLGAAAFDDMTEKTDYFCKNSALFQIDASGNLYLKKRMFQVLLNWNS